MNQDDFAISKPLYKPCILVYLSYHIHHHYSLRNIMSSKSIKCGSSSGNVDSIFENTTPDSISRKLQEPKKRKADSNRKDYISVSSANNKLAECKNLVLVANFWM